MSTNNILDNVLQLMAKQGMNQLELAERLGIDSQNITNWKRRGIPTNRLYKIAQILGTTVDGLYSRKSAVNEITDIHSPTKNVTITINRYDTGGAMGKGLILKEQPGVIEKIEVSQEWLAQNIGKYTSAKNLCLVTGFGDSMKPIYNPGDPLIVDIGVKKIDHDGVFFFRVGEEGFIKRLQRIPSENGLILKVKSANPDYEPWEITHKMDFEVLAKVIKVFEGKEF